MLVELASRLRTFALSTPDEDRRARAERLRKWVVERYNWDAIAAETLDVYRRAVMG